MKIIGKAIGVVHEPIRPQTVARAPSPAISAMPMQVAAKDVFIESTAPGVPDLRETVRRGLSANAFLTQADFGRLVQNFGSDVSLPVLVDRFEALGKVPVENPKMDAGFQLIIRSAVTRLGEAGHLADPAVINRIAPFLARSGYPLDEAIGARLFAQKTAHERVRAASPFVQNSTIASLATEVVHDAITSGELERGQLIDLIKGYQLGDHYQPLSYAKLSRAALTQIFEKTNLSSAKEVIESFELSNRARLPFPHTEVKVSPNLAFDFGLELLRYGNQPPELQKLGRSAIDHALSHDAPVDVHHARWSQAMSDKKLEWAKPKILQKLVAASDVKSPKVLGDLIDAPYSGVNLNFAEGQRPDLVSAMLTAAAQNPEKKFDLVVRALKKGDPTLTDAALEATRKLAPGASAEEINGLLEAVRDPFGYGKLPELVLSATSKRIAALADWHSPTAVIELESRGVFDSKGFATYLASGPSAERILRAQAFIASPVPAFRDAALKALVTHFETAPASEVLAWLEKPRELSAEDKAGLPHVLTERVSRMQGDPSVGVKLEGIGRAAIARLAKLQDPGITPRLKPLVTSRRFGAFEDAAALKCLEQTGDPKGDVAAALRSMGTWEVREAAMGWLHELVANPNDSFDASLDRLQTIGREFTGSLSKPPPKSGLSPIQRLAPVHRQMFRTLVIDPAIEHLSARTDWADERQVISVTRAIEALAVAGDPVIELPKAASAKLFGRGRELDLARANWLVLSKNPAFSAAAAKAVEQSMTLVEALDLEPGDHLRTSKTQFLSTHFTPTEVRDYLRQAPAGKLAERFSNAESFRPALARAPAMVDQAFAPAFQKWCSQLNWSDDAAVDALLAMAAKFGKERPLIVPSAYWAALEAKGIQWQIAHLRTLCESADPGLRGVAERLILSAVKSNASFDERAALLNAVPRHQLNSEVLAIVHAPSKRPIDTWQATIANGTKQLDSTIMRASETLERGLRAELLAGPAARALDTIAKILPPSLEQDRFVDEVLKRHGPWLPVDLLQRTSSYQTRPGPSQIRARRLEEAISKFPGNVANLIAFLADRGSADVFLDMPSDAVGARKALDDLKVDFAALEPSIQRGIVQRTLGSVLVKLKNAKDPAVQKQVDSALDAFLFSALNADPDAAKLSTRIRTVYDALPPAVQARVLADLMLSPKTTDAAEQLRRMLVSAGVVAIKAGQQMSEDPDVKLRFRQVLGSLRDRNAELAPAAFWRLVPQAERANYSELGPRLGTGSIKQVNRLRRTDGVEEVGAVLNPNVAADIDATMGALGVLPDTRHLVNQLKPMMAREIDFTQEAKSFDVLRATPIGRSANVNIPTVRVALPTFLARSEALGESVAELSRQGELTKAQRQALYELHVGLVRAALETDTRRPGAAVIKQPEARTYILTDPHEGNVALDQSRVGLFDPGQYETLSHTEADFFVSMLGSFRKPSLNERQRTSLVSRLTQLSQLADPNDGGPSLHARLDAAFQATLAEPEADVGRKLQLLLLAASKASVSVPDGYFGLAKMLHSLESQAAELKLRSAVTDSVIGLSLDQLGPVGRLASHAHGRYASKTAVDG